MSITLFISPSHFRVRERSAQQHHPLRNRPQRTLRTRGGDAARLEHSIINPRACTSLESNSTKLKAEEPRSSRKQALLIVDHGSKRSAANDMLGEIGNMVQEKNTALPVYTAHMELAEPTIADGIQQCVDNGATHILVVPFFLSPGRHATTDIPQMTEAAVAKFKDVTYEVRPPIGTHPGIIDVILDRAGLL